MALSRKEARMLEALMKKKDAPEPPSASRSLNISIDLGDEKQIERAQRFGLLDIFSGDDDDDDDAQHGDDDDDNDDDDEEAPRRRGYFT